jgi:hypothetical protein
MFVREGYRKIRPHYQVIAAGLDTLEVNGYGPLANYLPDLLNELQADAKALRNGKHNRTSRSQARAETFWDLDGQPLMMAPYGAGEGQYKWLLTCPAALFRLGRGNMNNIGVKVRLSSSFLWAHGYRTAWEMVKRALSEFGDFVFQPSEVDVCVDVAGMLDDRLRQCDFTRRGHVVKWHQNDALILGLKPGNEDTEPTSFLRYGEQEGLSFSPGSPHGWSFTTSHVRYVTRARTKRGLVISGGPMAGLVCRR